MLSAFGSTRRDQCFCPLGYFPNQRLGDEGSICTACHHGIDCQPVPSWKPLLLPGYAAVLNTYNVTSLADFELSQCVKLEACPGGKLGTCSEGGEGISCAECVAGYALSGGLCTPCPNAPWVMVFAVLVAVGVIVVMTHKMCKELRAKEISAKVSLTIASGQFFHVFQMCLVAGQLGMQMRRLSFLDVFARYALLLEACQLDCYFTNPVSTYIFTSCLPGLALLGFCLISFVDRSPTGKGAAATNSAGTLLQAVFIMVLLHALAPFIAFDQPGGKLSLLSHPHIIPGSPDHLRMVYIAVAQLVFYCGGFISLCCYACLKVHLAKQRRADLNDKDMKALVHKWHFLFFRFKNARFYWGLVLLARSTLVAMVPVISAGSFQWVILQCVLLGCLILHLHMRPWRELEFHVVDISTQTLFILLVIALQDTKHHEFAFALFCAIIAFLVGALMYSLRPKPKGVEEEADEAHAAQLLRPPPCIPTIDIRLRPDTLAGLQQQSPLIERVFVGGDGISEACDAELSLDAATRVLNIKVASTGLMWRGHALGREQTLLAMMGRLTAASMDGLITLQSTSNRTVTSANQQARILLGSAHSIIGRPFDHFLGDASEFVQFLGDAQRIQEGPALLKHMLLRNEVGLEIKARVFCVATTELVLLALQQIEKDHDSEVEGSRRGELGSLFSSAPTNSDGFLKAELHVPDGMLQNCCGTWCNEFQTAASHSLLEILSPAAIEEVRQTAYVVLSTDSERLIAPRIFSRRDGSRLAAMGVVDKQELTDPTDPGVVRLRLQIVPVGPETPGHVYPITHHAPKPNLIGRPSTHSEPHGAICEEDVIPREHKTISKPELHTAVETIDADLENLTAKSAVLTDSLAYSVSSKFHPQGSGTELSFGSLNLTEAELGVQDVLVSGRAVVTAKSGRRAAQKDRYMFSQHIEQSAQTDLNSQSSGQASAQRVAHLAVDASVHRELQDPYSLSYSGMAPSLHRASQPLQTSAVESQTDITWTETGWKCNVCARPPRLPADNQRLTSSHVESVRRLQRKRIAASEKRLRKSSSWSQVMFEHRDVTLATMEHCACFVECEKLGCCLWHDALGVMFRISLEGFDSEMLNK